MTTSELVAELAARGVTVTAVGEKLHVEAPAGRLTDELRRALVERKPALLIRLGAVIRIPLDDLAYGNWPSEHGLRIVGGTPHGPNGPRIYLAPLEVTA